MYSERPSSMSPVYVRSKVVGVTVYERIEGKGYLEVHVYYMGAEVVAEITITTLTGVLIGTYLSPSDFPLLLDIGQYVVSAKYRTYAKTETITIEEGKTTVWQVYFERKVCFVATACYGYGHPFLKTFRRFRDKILLTNIFGRMFVRIYYFVIGKPIALFLLKHHDLRLAMRRLLDITHCLFKYVLK